MSYENELEEIAIETEATEPTKKVREKRVRAKKYALYNEDGTRAINPASGAGLWGDAPCPNKPKKAPKAPKPVEYQKDEDGNDILDEEGNPIPVKKVRAPRLDADGNPIPRKSNVFLDSQTLMLTDKVPSYRAGTKRGDIFASIKDGMTVGEFYEKNGGKAAAHTFLVWYVNEAEVVEVV